jgi:cytochrome c-type biogenesis protein CcmH
MKNIQRKEEGLKKKEGFWAYVFLFSFLFSLFSYLSAQGETATTLDPKVFEIANELRCPVCTAESVGDSSSSVAVNMRNIIQDQLEQGKSKREILAFFQERYGDWILLNPPKRGVHLLVWLLPLVVAIVGVGLLMMYLKRWTKQAQTPVEASKEDLERVREEMKWQG